MPNEGLQSGQEQAVLQAQRDADRAGRLAQQRESLTKECEAQGRGDVVRVSINAPHRADVRGNQIALNIVTPDAPAGDSIAVATNDPFKVRDASTGGVDKVKTYKDSFLYDTTNLNTPFTIAGLDTAVAVNVGDLAYLAIATDGALGVTTVTNTIDPGWSGFDAMYLLDNTDPDNPVLDTMFVLIAEIVAVADPRNGMVISGTGTLKVIQHQRNNILLFAYPDAAGVPVFIPISI